MIGLLSLCFSLNFLVHAQNDQALAVGSKAFTESYVLSEIFSTSIESEFGLPVKRRFGLGGTGMAYNALRAGEIDFYVEYTGTILRAILKTDKNLTFSEIKQRMKKLGLVMSEPLGFNNTYAISMVKAKAQKNGIRTISDLQKATQLRFGASHEFINRKDGFRGLQAFYNLKNLKPIGMEHSLVYEAIAQGRIDVTDAYSTDAKIKRYNLVTLKDDKGFFPRYDAIILAREEFAQTHPKVWLHLRTFAGQFSEETMIDLNAASEIDKKSFALIATDFLDLAARKKKSRWSVLWRLTKEHAYLVFLSLFASVIIGVPLGVIATFSRFLSQSVLLVSGLLQTIPSLALLCLLIPFLGIGKTPAFVALLLYGLLPIVRNTYTGVSSIPEGLRESARALGFSQMQQIRKVFLPLASPYIMAGIKTSAVINVGTATLAALIGAGGYGVPIVTGLQLNDTYLILSGALPAAGFAILLHFFFYFVDQLVIPKGLRLKSQY